MAYGDQLNIRVPGDVKRAFIDKAKEDGTNATELLVGFMRQYLGIEDKGYIFSIDAAAIEAKLTEHLDTRIAEIEAKLASRLDISRANIGNHQQLGERLKRLQEEIGSVDDRLNERIDSTVDYVLNSTDATMNKVIERVSKVEADLGECVT